jgi:hypothetical protein
MRGNHIPDCPLVLVEWIDASRLSDGWLDWTAIPKPSPHKCVTVGFLVSENDKAKILVPTIADVEHAENRHTYGGMLIPKTAIISQRNLDDAKQ